MARWRKTGRLLLAVVMLAVTLIMVPGAAQAAETMDMQQMYFSIWPEYDTPDVLVIYSGTFVNNTGKPFDGDIVYRMPKDAKVNMVCETENGMVCQPYNDQTVEGDYRLVRWRPSHSIQPGAQFPVMFEYNFNTFTGGGQRDVKVPLKPDFPIGTLQVDVKAPLRAAEVKLTPQAQQTQSDQEGFTSYLYNYSNVKAGDELPFQVSYSRPDANPSVTKTTGASGGSTAAQGGKSSLNSTVIVLLVAFLAILAIFLVLALRGGSNSPRTLPAAGRGGGKASSGRKGGGQKHSPGSGKTGAARPAEKRAGQGAVAPGGKKQEEKKKIRRMLLDGKISEETYRQLMDELDEEED